MPLLLYTFAIIMDFNLHLKKEIFFSLFRLLQKKAKKLFIHILNPPRVLPSMSEFMAKYSSSVLKCRTATRVDTLQDERKA